MQLSIKETGLISTIETVFILGRDVWGDVQRVQKRTTTRNLSKDTVLQWCSDVVDAIDWCREHDIPRNIIIAKLDGGSVSKDYKFEADTTRVEYSNSTLHIGRDYVRRTHWSEDDLNYVRLCVFDEYIKDKLRALGCRRESVMWNLPYNV